MMRELIYIEECESTNAELLSLIKSKEETKELLVYTDYQTAGKGQGDGFWESEKAKNLTFSYNLNNIDLSAYNQFYISIITSISLVELVKSIIGDKEVKIKWPNDIYIGSKKVAGILIENVVVGDIIKESYIGIGLNVNQRKFESDAPNPISLLNIIEKNSNLPNLLKKYQLINNKYFMQLKNCEFEKLKANYLKLLYRINEKHAYIICNNEVDAMITGVDTHGFLQVNTQGVTKSFDIKEIIYL